MIVLVYLIVLLRELLVSTIFLHGASLYYGVPFVSKRFFRDSCLVTATKAFHGDVQFLRRRF